MDEAREREARLLEKRDALIKIRELTAEQGTLIEQDKVERLMECIEARQRLIDRIDELDAWLLEHDPSDVPGYRHLLTEMQSLLREIMEHDKRNERLAQERMEFYKKNLRDLSTQKKTNNAYDRLIGFDGSAYLDKRN